MPVIIYRSNFLYKVLESIRVRCPYTIEKKIRYVFHIVLAGSLLFFLKISATEAAAPPVTASTAHQIHLVADPSFLAALRGRIPAVFHLIAKTQLNSQELLRRVGNGDSLVWVGNSAGLPKELWVGAFRPEAANFEVKIADDSPLPLTGLHFVPSLLTSAYIHPTVELPYHNIMEEPRADLLPVLKAYDRFGQLAGYPGVLMRYYASSLAGGRFGGSDCFFFFFDKPQEAMNAAGWESLLQAIAKHFSSGVEIRRVQTDFASYPIGEQVNIHVHVGNIRPRAVATELYFYAKGPRQTSFHEVGHVRRCPEGGEESEADFEFIPGKVAGLWKIRVDAREDLAHAEELAVEGAPTLVDRREIGFVLMDGRVHTPSLLSISGTSFRIDGSDGFWVGTNYYPSSSWWDWLWRDFRPLKASQDFEAMRRAGYRIVRIWIDPVLDEQSFRAMDAAIYLAAQHGITLDVCIFTYWVRWLGFEGPNGHRVYFDSRHKDFNVYGISLRNLTLQSEYVQRLAQRWRGAGNIIYDLSNETAVRDPDPSQMDPAVLRWKGIPRTNGVLRDTLLFQHWTREITQDIRQAGGNQAIIPGYMFTSYGYGDSYLGERDGEIESWHSYQNPEAVGETLSYVDPGCSNRPLLLEEFGTVGWNHPKQYDAMAHFALAAGAAAAMSYEWGVSWLAPEMSFYPTPLREILEGKPDPRWFKPAISIAKHWSARSPGIFPAPSGFEYGSIFSGTPFPAGAAIALGRLGLIHQDLGRAIPPERTYIVVPTAMPLESGGMADIEQIVHGLWSQKAPFGVWQEDCLDHLPNTARVIIAPAAASQHLKTELDRLRHSGVDVFIDKNSEWQTSRALTRLPVTPASAELVVRRTREGTLYFLFNREPVQLATLETERHGKVSLGLSNFALIHERANGIGLVEASGPVSINGSNFCRIDGPRAIIESDGGDNLRNASSVRVIATGPARIHFDRSVRSITILEPGRSQPLATYPPQGSDKTTINIDGEMTHYIIKIDFSKTG